MATREPPSPSAAAAALPAAAAALSPSSPTAQTTTPSTRPARSPATPARAATTTPASTDLQEKTPNPVDQIEDADATIPALDFSPELLDWGGIEDDDGAYAGRGGLQYPPSPSPAGIIAGVQPAPDQSAIAHPEPDAAADREKATLKAGCSYAAVAKLKGLASSSTSKAPAHPALKKTEAPAKLKSAIGVDLTRRCGVFTRLSAPDAPAEKKDLSQIWVEVKHKQRKRKYDIPLQAGAFKCQNGRLLSGGSAGDKLPAYKEAFVGRCFRCLASDHRLAQCRDPPRCLSCRRCGHFARDCPERRRGHLQASKKPISSRRPPSSHPTSIHSRLVFPLPNIHSRLSFPPLRLTHDLPIPEPQPSAEPMEYVPGLPDQRPERTTSVVVASDSIVRESNRLCSHAVVITTGSEGYRPSVLEVAYGLSQQLRIPRYNIKVSRHRPEDFLAVFDFAPQCDRAVAAGQIVVGGTALTIEPWRPTSHGTPRTWWFSTKVSIESMPLELWSVKGASKVLGDSCIVDRLDSRTFNKEVTHTFSCWVWMSNPDHLPRSHGCLVFPKDAGRPLEMVDLPTPRRRPGTPPVGRPVQLLIHLDEYYDWTPSTTRVSPVHQRFDWTPGVMDGCDPMVSGHAGGCRGVAAPLRREHDQDDDRRGPRREGERSSIRGPRAPGAHDGVRNGINGQRNRTRSPPPGRRQQSMGAARCGREHARSPIRVWRPRDPQRRDAEDWERRRSRSPTRRSTSLLAGTPPKKTSSYYEVEGVSCTAPCFGNLESHAAAGPDAPSPPREHPDPLLNFFKVLCTEPFPVDTYSYRTDEDPMMQEAALAARASTLLSVQAHGLEGDLSPPDYINGSSIWSPGEGGDRRLECSPPLSPAYQPTSGPWAATTDIDAEVTFGPGVQLEHNTTHALEDITMQVTRMDIDAPSTDHGLQPSITEQVFTELPPPVLDTPARLHREPPAPVEEPVCNTNTRRASSRLAARPSPIPVSKRAQHRLLRELNFINKDERIIDDVVSAYIETYKTPLPAEAVTALRTVARLKNKATSSALATLVEEDGAAVDMEAA
ncbi:hypothetical protein HU200_034271 [Digitaria exilis]|uniref:CCHC-type domain-containing protein n=1 Tax=Digitaria exilis TaxID=1010633 RepID=A0A835BKS2_9POAL|nr:hypothetical protein HU200_034271 [Digitaria exilis]